MWPALQDAKYIDENFMTLILYLKDNKDTFGSTLPSSFYTEFDAITSVLLPKINAYNSCLLYTSREKLIVIKNSNPLLNVIY